MGHLLPRKEERDEEERLTSTMTSFSSFTPSASSCVELEQQSTNSSHSEREGLLDLQAGTHNTTSPTNSSPVKYGEIIVLGYNGALPQGNKGRRRSKFAVMQKPEGNGVKPTEHHYVDHPGNSQLMKNPNQHSMSFTLVRGQTIIVQYDHDSKTDMFQIGRSAEPPIDLLVLDTVPGPQRAMDSVITQSTVSRFACRISVEREYPYVARLYAGGFDSDCNMLLGEGATKWYNEGEIDALTTNGVLIQKPVGDFCKQAKPGVWQEVSVGGRIYALRSSRSMAQERSIREKEDNILRDGTLIDLCGVTLLWRSGALDKSAETIMQEMDNKIKEINSRRPQCPIGLNTLQLPHSCSRTETRKQPYVYMNCGHVHGWHEWGVDSATNTHTCPLCRQRGPFVKLQLGAETSLYVDCGKPDHCFFPCGHFASEQTIKKWCNTSLPHGCDSFIALCPFCATPITGDPGWVKLFFQDKVASSTVGQSNV